MTDIPVFCCKNCPYFCAEKRDIYLAFKALNVSETGILTEEEFMDVYSVTKLKWKVSYDKLGINKFSNIIVILKYTRFLCTSWFYAYVHESMCV